MNAKLIKQVKGTRIILGIKGTEQEINDFHMLAFNWGLYNDPEPSWLGPCMAYMNVSENKLLQFFSNIVENRIARKLQKTEFGPRFQAYCHKKAIEELSQIPEVRFVY